MVKAESRSQFSPASSETTNCGPITVSPPLAEPEIVKMSLTSINTVGREYLSRGNAPPAK